LLRHWIGISTGPEREAFARLQAVFETVVDGIITIDERGTIETVNPAALRCFGYNADELVGQNVRILMPEPYCGEHDSYLANYLCTREPKIIGIGREVLGRRRDGSSFPLELAVSETMLKDRRIFTGIIRDISPRYEAERALRESEERFRLMANSAPVLIWMSGVDGACTWFNKRWLEFTGRTVEEQLGNGWARSVHPDDVENCLRTYHAAFDARVPLDMEYRLMRADGEYRWVHDAGVPMHLNDTEFAGYIGSCTDVTDRKLNEEQLRKRVARRTSELSASNERLQFQIEERRRIELLLATENRILELVATGEELEELLEALCDALERIIPNARCAIRLTPWKCASDSEQESTAGLDVFGKIAREGVLPQLCSKRTILTRDRAIQVNASFEPDTQLIWYEPIVGSGGATLGTLGVYDAEAARPNPDAISAGEMATRLAAVVVERERADERAREQLAQLAHVARLATMGEMASGLAHELNQPLCAIVNFAEACVEIVQQRNYAPKELARALGEVARQAERAGEVIRRYREFVKRREPQRQAVDINTIIREVIEFTSAEARQEQVRVRSKLAKSLPKVFADYIQIEQVLVNLVCNACEAMGETEQETRTITIETLRRRGAVEIAVSDTGPGVAPEKLDRLFDSFFTTKPDGMGMGLSISRSILEVHDGRLWGTPNRKGGMTFHFTLPTAWRILHDRKHRIRRG
jgi:hypothetical protein